MKRLLRQCSGKADAAAILAVAGTVLLAARWAAARPMWLDEEMIVLNVRGRSAFGLHGPLWLGQSAPLGWLLLERACLALFGDGERSLRLVPVAFGIAMPWTALRVGRRWMGPVGAAVLVLLTTFSIWLGFHSLELKPYSADAWFGLLLPALAAQAIASERDSVFLRRMRGWWAIAAAGQWVSNGALLLAPTTAAVLAGDAIRRRSVRGFLEVAVPGLGWTAMFGLHYALTTRFAIHSTFLRNYWRSALPPDGAGVAERVQWIVERIMPFGIKPGSTTLPLLFWIAAALGLLAAIRGKRALAVAFAPVPLAGFAFAAVGQVPLWERLSLWMVPALDVGIAVLADASLAAVAAVMRRRDWRGLAAAAGGLAVSGAALWGVVHETWREHYLFVPGGSNHGLDDRAGVRWLMARHRPGDVLLTTHLAEPAIWWYAGAPLADPVRGRTLADGSPIVEVSPVPSSAPCDQSLLRAALHGRARALVYFGFRFDDVPPAFDDVLLRKLSEFGTMAAYRSFSDHGRAAVFDVAGTERPQAAVSPRPDARPEELRPVDDYCIAAAPAERW